MDVTTIPQGTGSGFIWDDKGHVVTNYHVVRGANAIRVTLFDSTSCSATIVGADENKDIAVLKLEVPDRQAAALRKVMVGRSTGLAVGQKVFAIGNPFGLDHTLTSVRFWGMSQVYFMGTACDHMQAIATCLSAHKVDLCMN
jgi:S1-C subfamily serine protease